MPSNHPILCYPLLLLPSIWPNIRVFYSESVLPIKWPKCWSFSFSISPSNEYLGLISFKITSWPSYQMERVPGKKPTNSQCFYSKFSPFVINKCFTLLFVFGPFSEHWYTCFWCVCVQSCPALCDHMDCSLPGLSGIFQEWNFPGKYTRDGCHFLLQAIFLTQGLNPCLLCLLHWQIVSLPTEPPGKLIQYFFWEGIVFTDHFLMPGHKPHPPDVLRNAEMWPLSTGMQASSCPQTSFCQVSPSGISSSNSACPDHPWGWWPRITTVTASKDWGKSRSFRDWWLRLQQLRLHSPNASGPGSIPDEGIRSHMSHRCCMLQQGTKTLRATTKTR